MTYIQIITGKERVNNSVELQAYEWYVLHEKCPIRYTGGEGALAMQRIIGLSKLKAEGPKGHTIKKTHYENLEHLDALNRHEKVRASVIGWNRCDFDIPDGVIIRLHVTQKSCIMGRQSYSSNLFFKVRSTGPYLQVRYKDGYGLPFLLKGRMDRLSAEYVIKHKLISDERFLGTLGEVSIERFIEIDELERATEELLTPDKMTSETLTVNGVTVTRNRKRPSRKVIV